MAYYNPYIHHRRSIRLKGYDYSQAGVYFVTICAQHHACLFGNICMNDYNLGDHDLAAEMVLNDAGKMIESEWLTLPERFPDIRLHEFTIMPNHFHAIIQIVGATTRAAPMEELGGTVGAFKSLTTGKYIHGVKHGGWPPFDGKLWQRNYWEHIIRNEESYRQIAEYIVTNPARWQNDKLYVPQ